MRIVREILFSVLLLRCSGALAQAFDDGPYYPFAPYEEERMPELESDSLLFYRAVQQADDLWAEVSAFRFSAVSYRRRGEDYALSPVLLEGAEVSWRYLTALRRLQAETRYVAGARPQVGRLSVGAGATAVSLTEYDPVPGGALALRAATRNYRAGAEGSLAFELPRRWHLAVTVDGRFGRDALVDGVYTRQTTAALRVGRRTRGDGYWTAVFVVPFAERGLRSSSVEEAFMLRGSNYYNPAWGRQAGDVRNSRVRREGLPLGIVAYCGRIGGSTLLRASAAVETGIRCQSSLAWYDASTPRPDNYHYLPSYFTGEAFEAVDAVWRTGDERYTQIDWAQLYRRNRMQPDGEALYALEDRVERPLRMQTAIRIESEVDPQLTVACALRVDYDAPRRYKQLRDLLGADRLTDIDRFLLDDATYSNRLQNDLRHPDRTVGEGDRFGYDYRTVRCEVAADGVVRYRSDRWTAAFGASVGRCVVRRRGFYEKELFPGAGSYGGSSRLRFTPYALRASAGYAFSSRSYLEISASASAAVPDVEDLFLQPLYNNRTVDDPSLSRRYGAELGFVRTGGAFELRVTGYLAATRDEIRTTRFFDDLSYEYCDMTVRGIGRLDYGAEAAARLRLTWNWSLSAAVGAGSHTYATNPSALHRCGQRAPRRRRHELHERSSARRHGLAGRDGRRALFRPFGVVFLCRCVAGRRTMGRAVVPLPDFACGEPGLRFARNIRSFHGAGAAGRLLYGRCLGGENVAAGRVETVGHAVGTQPARRLSHGLLRLRVRSGAAPAQRCRDLLPPVRYEPALCLRPQRDVDREL